MFVVLDSPARIRMGRPGLYTSEVIRTHPNAFQIVLNTFNLDFSSFCHAVLPLREISVLPIQVCERGLLKPQDFHHCGGLRGPSFASVFLYKLENHFDLGINEDILYLVGGMNMCANVHMWPCCPEEDIRSLGPGVAAVCELSAPWMLRSEFCLSK